MQLMVAISDRHGSALLLYSVLFRTLNQCGISRICCVVILVNMWSVSIY